MHHRSCRRGAKNDVAKFILRRQTALREHVVCEFLAGWHRTPAELTAFWLLMALMISGTVILSLASWSGFTQILMAYCPAPKTVTEETPTTRLRGSLKFI